MSAKVVWIKGGPSDSEATTPIDMPTWTDATSVASYITSVLDAGIAVIGLVHPGFIEPAAVQACIPAVALLIAGGAQIANLIRHTKATTAALSR